MIRSGGNTERHILLFQREGQDLTDVMEMIVVGVVHPFYSETRLGGIPISIICSSSVHH